MCHLDFHGEAVGAQQHGAVLGGRGGHVSLAGCAGRHLNLGAVLATHLSERGFHHRRPFEHTFTTEDLLSPSLSTCTNYQIRIFRPQTLGGPFSAVSKPIFATKYSFCSIFRNLPYLHTFAPIQIQNFAKFCQTFLKISEKSLKILSNFGSCSN